MNQKNLGPLWASEVPVTGEQMQLSKPEDLARAIGLVEKALKDPRLLALYDEGDKMSSSQTKHDVGHAFSVLNVATQLTAEVEEMCPGTLDNWPKVDVDAHLRGEWTRRVVIPLGAFLHDIGRAIEVDNHAGAGAHVANEYLKMLNFPTEVRKRVARIVALHRSSSVLSREFDDPAWAIVVIADKCVGDEDRVRPAQARILKVLRFLGIADRNWWDNASHDRINFAIKDAQLDVDSNDTAGPNQAGAIVLKLKIDEKVAKAEEMTTLYGERFHACGRGAQYLGFVFRIEFNGVRYAYDKTRRCWRAKTSISVPLP